jgi:ArsR family transcriptional regulator
MRRAHCGEGLFSVIVDGAVDWRLELSQWIQVIVVTDKSNKMREKQKGLVESEICQEHYEDKWGKQADLLRAVAHPMRMCILEMLSDGSRCVKDLNALLPVAQPRLSRHMAALRKAELVACHSDGPLRCYYVLRPKLIRQLLSMMRGDHPPVYRSREAVRREAKQNTRE